MRSKYKIELSIYEIDAIERSLLNTILSIKSSDFKVMKDSANQFIQTLTNLNNLRKKFEVEERVNRQINDEFEEIKS